MKNKENNQNKLAARNRIEHSIDSALICEGAQNVISQLHAAGYKAYIVGGGVRDLLLVRCLIIAALLVDVFALCMFTLRVVL